MSSRIPTTPLTILISDLGSPEPDRLHSTLRELGAVTIGFPEGLSPEQADAWIEENPADAVILTGGDDSVFDPQCPDFHEGLIDMVTPRGLGVPLLCINYAMRWVSLQFEGIVKPVADHRDPDNGHVDIRDGHTILFAGIHGPIQVPTSRGDIVVSGPHNCRKTALFSNGATAALENPFEMMFGIQFYPEAMEDGMGRQILLNFCQYVGDWVRARGPLVRDYAAIEPAMA